VRRRRLRLQPERPFEAHRERLRDPGDFGRPAAPRHDVNLSAGTIDHVVNGVVGPADVTRIGAPVYVVDYP
jgi:hypothetical protein